MKDKDGETRRERNESFEIDSPEVEVPENGYFLWEWFWELRESTAPGFSGSAPVTNQELAAWVGITGNIVRREEVRVLKSMNSRYCAEIDKESEAIREREAEH